MKNIDHKPKPSSSIFKEMMLTFVLFFFGDVSTKLGAAFIALLLGVLVIIRPFKDMDGNELEKSFISYLIGSVLIALSIVLVISWLRKRNNKL